MSNNTSTSSTNKFAPTPPVAAKKLSTFLNFATAGFGGVVGWCVVHPFNTVAVRMSLANMSGT